MSRCYNYYRSTASLLSTRNDSQHQCCIHYHNLHDGQTRLQASTKRYEKLKVHDYRRPSKLNAHIRRRYNYVVDDSLLLDTQTLSNNNVSSSQAFQSSQEAKENITSDDTKRNISTNDKQHSISILDSIPTHEEIFSFPLETASHLSVRTLLERCRRFAKWKECLYIITRCANVSEGCIISTAHCLLESTRLIEAHEVLRFAQGKNIKIPRRILHACVRGCVAAQNVSHSGRELIEELLLELVNEQEEASHDKTLIHRGRNHKIYNYKMKNNNNDSERTYWKSNDSYSERTDWKRNSQICENECDRMRSDHKTNMNDKGELFVVRKFVKSYDESQTINNERKNNDNIGSSSMLSLSLLSRAETQQVVKEDSQIDKKSKTASHWDETLSLLLSVDNDIENDDEGDDNIVSNRNNDVVWSRTIPLEGLNTGAIETASD